MMRSSNPALSLDTFTGFGRTIDRSDRMTIGGTVLKTAILLLCALLSAGYTWGLFSQNRGAIRPRQPLDDRRSNRRFCRSDGHYL